MRSEARMFGTWLGVCLLAVSLAYGQSAPEKKPDATPPAAQTGQAQTDQPQKNEAPKPQAGQPALEQPETHITKQQAKDLFASVDEILKFASDDTKLPIKHPVKRRLTTRAAVEKYVVAKFNDDEDARRMERSEVVLKKFGLLDRDFQLKPFLISLLKEQIAGYYDNKTKTVNLLDWIEPDSQKPVLAHELTHALQDQHTDLEKWEGQTPNDLAHNVTEDNQHLSIDEEDSARDAVLEGQAMAVFMDYNLKPLGKTMLTAPDVVEKLKDQMDDDSGSPVMTRAPLLLQESLLFPYREGLSFEQVILKESGPTVAFAGVLDDPPATSFEIMNPKAYQAKQKIPLLKMPDVHPLLDAEYGPLDVGVMGQLDVRILVELFAGQQLAAALTPAWDGGLYYAVQSRKARTTEERAATSSVSLLYLSAWKSAEAARAFAEVYASELDKKYSHVSRDKDAETVSGEQIFRTSEGPVLIVTNGKQVFVSESFDLTVARKLQLLVTGAQTDEQMRQAAVLRVPRFSDPAGTYARFFGNFGMMKSALPRIKP